MSRVIDAEVADAIREAVKQESQRQGARVVHLPRGATRAGESDFGAGVTAVFVEFPDLEHVSIWDEKRKVFSANWSPVAHERVVMTFRPGPWLGRVVSCSPASARVLH